MAKDAKMDILPIKPASTNKVDATINLANDGASKSNTGYFSNRDHEEHHTENVDEVRITHSRHNENEAIDEEKKLLGIIQTFLNKIKNFILKILGLKKEKIPNIYEKSIH